MKKVICIILVMFLIILTSCAAEESKPVSTETEQEETTNALDARLSVSDGITDELDFGGAAFNIVTQNGTKKILYQKVKLRSA